MAPGSEHSLPMFGRRLRQLRRATGTKQSALADALQVTQSTVSRWEAGAQTPEQTIQNQAFELLGARSTDDAALRRLVEQSSNCVHLVEETTHRCLAYSAKRASEWKSSRRSMLGVSLWQFATEEIWLAENELEDSDWWDARQPRAKHFYTSRREYDEITISAGGVLWERLYLADGTPARLCTLT